jgi:hypothetical protein
MPHREIPVQVTAWIDEGVADLVVALNAWPGVITLDSCEADYRTGRARVSFCTYDRATVFDVLPRLAVAVGGHGLAEHVALTPWPDRDDDLPGADITCPSPLVSAVAKALANAARTTS